jgi:hypothetical protein
MRHLGSGQTFSASARRRGRLIVASKPAAERAFARQRLPRKSLGQRAKEEARAPVGMKSFEFQRDAKNITSRGGVTSGKAAVRCQGNLATVIAATLEKMTNRAGRDVETLRQFGGGKTLLGSSPQGLADGLIHSGRHDPILGVVQGDPVATIPGEGLRGKTVSGLTAKPTVLQQSRL